MAELTQLKTTQPELTPVQIADASKGKEAIASVFGDVANAAETQVVALKKEQSDVMLMDRQNQAYEIANTAKVNALKNPDQGDAIARNAHTLFSSLYNGLDEKQATRLRSSIDVHAGGMDLEIARVTARQNKIQVRSAFANTFGSQIQTMKGDFNPDSFKQSYQLAYDSLNAQLALGMTAHEYQNYKKTLDYTLEYHQGINDMLKSGNLDAQKLASMQAASVTNESDNVAGHPINQTTQTLYDIHTNEKSYSAAKALAGRGTFPNLENLTALTPAHFHSVVETYQGAMNAKGFINSNGSIREANLRYERLQAMPTHTPREEGELNYYKTIFNKFHSDQYWNVLSATNGGQPIDQNHVQQLTAINNGIYKGTEEEQSQARNKSTQDENARYLDDKVNLGRSQDIPTQMIQPVDQGTIRAAQSGFQIDGDPDTTLQTLYSMPQNQQFWLTRTMNDQKTGKSNKNEALYATGLLRVEGNQPTQFQKDLIISNRDKIDTSVLKFGNSKEEKETHNTVIRTNVIAQLNPVLNYLSSQPEGNQINQGYANGLTEAGQNYVKYQMITHGDFHGENGEQYAKEFADHVAQGYKIYKGHNSEFNLNEVNLTESQADVIADHILHNFRDTMHSRLIKIGIPEAVAQKRISEAFDTNALIVRNTRDGQIVVMDSSNAVIYGEPLTSFMHVAANARHKENSKMTLESMLDQPSEGE